MESARFLRLAFRVFAYEGVMAARVMAEQQKREAPKDNLHKALIEGHGEKTSGSSQPSYLIEKLKGAD